MLNFVSLCRASYSFLSLRGCRTIQRLISEIADLKGVADARAMLVVHAILYVRKHRPKMFLMENVKNLALQKRFDPTWQFIQSEHAKDQ